MLQNHYLPQAPAITHPASLLPTWKLYLVLPKWPRTNWHVCVAALSAATQTHRWRRCWLLLLHSAKQHRTPVTLLCCSDWRSIAVLNSKKRSKLTARWKQPSLACAAGPVRLQHSEQEQSWDEMQNYTAMDYISTDQYTLTTTQYIMVETRGHIKSVVLVRLYEERTAVSQTV